MVPSFPAARLSATYRLQMNASFTLANARARVGYFAALGVSHLYLSPIVAARRGSMHGYDVIDPTRINPELGSEGDLRALSSDLAARGMGLIVDIVPNHMGIGPENRFWDDVLEHGERSRYARWFDIDWDAQHKVILPFLGDELDRVLERGELTVSVAGGARPRLVHAGHSYPIDPATFPPELELARADPEAAAELAAEFSRPARRAALRALIDAQHYRLAFWRRGPTDINYRRFFDVNDLAALRVEDTAVFDETHAYTLGLVRDGVIHGLRVDHVDGLLDPAEYLTRLRAATPADMPIFVEKILAQGERLRASWPVQGTTGYEFLNDADDVFLDPAGFAEIDRLYRRLRRLGATTYADVARAGKIGVLTGPLRADVERVSRLAAAISSAAGTPRPLADIVTALVDFVAAFQVYRTYVDGRSPVDPADRFAIETASRNARAVSAQPELVSFLATLMLGAVPAVDDDARLGFVQRLQQLCAPATAKGVEDTAFYVYVPLVSRDEVGGGPNRSLENAVARIHQTNQERAATWPLSLLCTETHDTKRSADVRARLGALTEIPRDWDRAVRRWRRLNAKHRRIVNGRLAPDTNTEYLLYQTLVAIWPPPSARRRMDDLPDRAWRDAARSRLLRYAIKAAREAKTSTSWIDPSSAYETALEHFLTDILEPKDDAPFLPDVARLVARVAYAGAWNSFSRIAIHLTAPGTPDIYQGDELWKFALVDPDNRGAVDYAFREAMLAGLTELDGRLRRDADLDLFDHRVKLLVTHRLLRLRRERTDLFTRGAYRPLVVRGPRADHLVAFARTWNDEHSMTLAPRLMCGVAQGQAPLAEWWAGTVVQVPEDLAATQWMSQITGDIASDLAHQPAELDVASALGKLPVAVFAG